MKESLLENRDFALLLNEHARQILLLLFAQNREFEVLANMSMTSFEPELPKSLKPGGEMALFALGGYTLSSAHIKDNALCFHAGFGQNDFESMVKIELGAIIRLSIEKDVLFVNFSIYDESKDQQTQVEKSKNIFKSNPDNKDIFK